MKKHKDNLLLPPWANFLIRHDMKNILVVIMVLCLPIYFVLYSDAFIDRFEYDLDQVKRT